MNKKAVLFLIHIPVWMVVFAFVIISVYNNIHRAPELILLAKIITVTWLLSSFYLFYSLLVPKYLAKNRYREFAVYAGLFVLLIMPLLMLSLNAVIFSVFDEKERFPPLTSAVIFTWIGIIVGTLFSGTLGVFYRFGIDWFKHQQLKKDLENKNLQSELETLKSKLNPHLLFNTLNNIDTLIQTSPDQASVALSKLSDILRYVVYDTEQETVSIQKEIENIRKYIDLEKIRLHYPDSVEFINHIADPISVPPMLFFPFVENGFKHSNLNNPNHCLKISLSMDNDKIVFDCTNTIDGKANKNTDNGMGLELAKKRLDLLYPDAHKLRIENMDNTFHVNLEIEVLNG